MRSILVATLLFGTSATAHAHEPRIASDAFYIGADLGPGAALLAAWDLDVYFSSDRRFSLGPGVAVAVLRSGERFGNRQNFRLGVDILRLKVAVNEDPGNFFRPYVFVGGGFSYTALAEDEAEGGTPGMPAPTVPSEEVFGGLLSVGLGTDLFFGGPWGMSMLFTTRFQLGDNERIPEISAELAIGIRFGL